MAYYFFMYFVYIIQSETTSKYYIGMTSDITKRLNYHNRGASRYTRNKGPWVLVHRECFESKKEAWLRERQIKSYKGGEAFKRLIGLKYGEVA